MACLLLLAIFGTPATVVDPYAARGALVAVFVAVQIRRFQCLALRYATVGTFAFLGALIAVIAHRAIISGVGAITPQAGGAALAASAINAGLMVISFHYLTLRRGFMG